MIILSTDGGTKNFSDMQEQVNKFVPLKSNNGVIPNPKEGYIANTGGILQFRGVDTGSASFAQVNIDAQTGGLSPYVQIEVRDGSLAVKSVMLDMAGLQSPAYIPPSNDNSYVQKKYVDEQIAEVDARSYSYTDTHNDDAGWHIWKPVYQYTTDYAPFGTVTLEIDVAFSQRVPSETFSYIGKFILSFEYNRFSGYAFNWSQPSSTYYYERSRPMGDTKLFIGVVQYTDTAGAGKMDVVMFIDSRSYSSDSPFRTVVFSPKSSLFVLNNLSETPTLSPALDYLYFNYNSGPLETQLASWYTQQGCTVETCDVREIVD